MPLQELHVTTVDELRPAPRCHSLLSSDKQVDCDSSLDMVTNVLAVIAFLASSILALPLELASVEEVVLVLELTGQMADPS
jgi:hypothetical protein